MLAPRTFAPVPTLQRSSRRASLVFALPLVLVGIGAGLCFLSLAAGLAVGVIGLLAFGLNVLLGRTSSLLEALPSGHTTPHLESELVNLIDGLCLSNGLTAPSVRILDDQAPNAMILGDGERRATFVCTTGLLARLDRIELEALVAHELAHLKQHSISVSRRAILALGLYSRLSASSARILVRLLGPDLSTSTDQTAATMTRYPPGLVAALSKVAQAGETRPRCVSGRLLRLTGALWFVPIFERPIRALPGELDLGERIALLAEL